MNGKQARKLRQLARKSSVGMSDRAYDKGRSPQFGSIPGAGGPRSAVH